MPGWCRGDPTVLSSRLFFSRDLDSTVFLDLEKSLEIFTVFPLKLTKKHLLHFWRKRLRKKRLCKVYDIVGTWHAIPGGGGTGFVSPHGMVPPLPLENQQQISGNNETNKKYKNEKVSF